MDFFHNLFNFTDGHHHGLVENGCNWNVATIRNAPILKHDYGRKGYLEDHPI